MKRRDNLRRRGFLGPIGDDIPSIFPIIFGVLIFIGTMIYAVDQINARNSYLDIRKATLSLSSVVMESGYMSDSGFISACDASYKVFASRQSIHALITVEKFCPLTSSCYPQGTVGLGPVDLSKDIFNVTGNTPAASYDPSAGLYCDSNDPVDTSTRNQYALSGGVRPATFPKDFVALTFPVAVDCCPQSGSLRGVGMVNIIGWK